MSLTNYAENQYLDYVADKTNVTGASGTWIGLLSSATEGSEVELSNTGYSRQSIAWKAGSANNKRKNNGSVYFRNENSTTWASATHWGIFDASSGGNLLITGGLGNTYTLRQDDIYHIVDGGLELVWNGVGSSNGWYNEIYDILGIDTQSGTSTAPTTHYAALHTSISNEVTHSEYSRVSVTLTGTGNSRSNSNELIFEGTPPYDWGDINYVAVYANSSGGDPLFMAGAGPKRILSNDKVVIFANELTFTVE